MEKNRDYNNSFYKIMRKLNFDMEKQLRIPLSDTESVSGLLNKPVLSIEPGKGLLVLAHGAGRDMRHPFLQFIAEGLARNGFSVLRFNFLYKELGRKMPDREPLLTKTWNAALKMARSIEATVGRSIFAAGKSMGGRIASIMASRGDLPVAGLIYLGYPLHPPGKKDRLRVEHLPAIRIPQLFISGTRDSLCDLSLLHKVLGGLSFPWELREIVGGDHSFKVLKSLNQSQESIYSTIVETIAGWMDGQLRRL